MKISKIELYNFGSYAGHCSFDFSTDDQNKRIVVIGGKNGAGKTTLFTAIQVCLYGSYAFGYKTAGYFYRREVNKLINSDARIKQDESSHITVEFQHVDGRESINYTITRGWNWETGDITESLAVLQNGYRLDEDGIGSFQNYLIHLIPPEMLKLYFFDGEKIADYFLSENRINIRDALMILSGNDTFDILHNNVKRVINLNKDSDTSEAANGYFICQSEYDKLCAGLEAINACKEEKVAELEENETRLEELRSQYIARGGITQEDLNRLQLGLKTEEDERAKINMQRKAVATDILPFVIIRDWIDRIQPQIEMEEGFNAHQAIESKISDPSFVELLSAALNEVGVTSKISVAQVSDKIRESLLSDKWKGFMPLLQLSNDEKRQIYSVLNRVFEYDTASMRTYQKKLDASLERTKSIRAKIQSSDAEHIEEYIRETTRLEENIKHLKSEIDQYDVDMARTEEFVAVRNRELANARKAYESVLKKASVVSLSGRVLLMLEDLQNNIYSEMIRKVEADLKFKLRQLLRKSRFFDDIIIDADFNVHILRDQELPVEDLIQIVKRGGQNLLKSSVGDVAVDRIMDGSDQVTNAALISALQRISDKEIELPVEINKDNMSSGEKQIFVMSLYWAMMQQSDSDLPFIIDTPFARIDTEHRTNITEHFFKDLKGQLFVLSTNEELGGAHISTMQDQISHTYMLECDEDKQTRIYQDSYFGV